MHSVINSIKQRFWDQQWGLLSMNRSASGYFNELLISGKDSNFKEG